MWQVCYFPLKEVSDLFSAFLECSPQKEGVGTSVSSSEGQQEGPAVPGCLPCGPVTHSSSSVCIVELVFTWCLTGHLPSQCRSGGRLGGGDGVGRTRCAMFHGFGGKHCAIGSLRNNFASRHRHWGSERVGQRKGIHKSENGSVLQCYVAGKMLRLKIPKH